MPTVYDVPAELLIPRLVEHLKRAPKVQPPSWARFAKTGPHAERPPQSPGWWYTRCASLLRKVYLHGPIGLSELESMYGGRTSFGYAKAHHMDAGGVAVRRPLQQLEAAGLVEKKGGKGRFLTREGVSLLDRLSSEIFEELAKSNKELSRYA